ncbi:hypothetical protein ABTW72_12805 [Micromonospora sp. NPDC127501]|uniref:hypothetical protein n=1 Tax=Micromonospora sp. NPDC127501 TaxID=3154872 RepID=UPI003332BEB4
MKKTLRRAAGASALGILFTLAAVPGIAQAATTKCAYDGSDRACATNNNDYTSSQQVCDNEDDGRKVTAWFILSDGTQTYYSDSYGGGCKTATNSKRVAWFVMAEDGGPDTPAVFMY